MKKRILSLALLATIFACVATSCVRPPHNDGGGRSQHGDRHQGPPDHH